VRGDEQKARADQRGNEQRERRDEHRERICAFGVRRHIAGEHSEHEADVEHGGIAPDRPTAPVEQDRTH